MKKRVPLTLIFAAACCFSMASADFMVNSYAEKLLLEDYRAYFIRSCIPFIIVAIILVLLYIYRIEKKHSAALLLLKLEQQKEQQKMEQEVQKKKAELASLQYLSVTNNDLQQENKCLCHAISRLRSELDRSRTGPDHLRTENERLRAQIQKATDDADSLRSALSHLSTQNAELKRRNSLLSEPLKLETSRAAAAYLLYHPYLSFEEYNFQPDVQKYQLALDRWKKRSKSSWDIGIEYERFIGFLYETEYRCKVTYTGAIKGKRDDGRDLIVTKPSGEVMIIQCKCWARGKEIHTSYIHQLHGVVDSYRELHPEQDVRGVFITSARLSTEAWRDAKIHKLNVFESQYSKPYPLVKCICHTDTQTKHYYLPIDAQYDSVDFDVTKGDCYVETVAEAEKSGFTHP